MRNYGKKVIYLVLLTLLLFCLTGCSGREKEKQPDDRVEDNSGKNKPDKAPGGKGEITAEDFQLGSNPGWKGELTAEDYQPGNSFVMKTEKGYYYHRYEKTVNDDKYIGAFRYVDSATGKDIYLCNKPECKHDGNIFCVATNDKYTIGQTCLYNGRIFATALETTDTQYLFKLLAIALDGSEMSEIATYMTIGKMAAESAGQVPLIGGNSDNLVVHRNKTVLPLAVVGRSDDTDYRGTAVLDLDTGKVSYLDEEPLSKENAKIEGVSAYGDYIYYYRKEGRKNVLHRYCVKDGADESLKLQSGFQGMYAVLDEDNIVYTRYAANVLHLYHPSTGESEEAKTLQAPARDEQGFWTGGIIDVQGLMTDGTYLYAARGTMILTSNDGHKITKREIYVLDRNLEIIAVVNMAEVLPEGIESTMNHTWEYNWSFLDDEIYTVFLPNEDNLLKTAVYKCKRSDFLEGNPKYEFLYEPLSAE